MLKTILYAIATGLIVKSILPDQTYIFSILPAIIAGVGALGAGAMNYFGNKETNKQNLNLANSSWQRGMTDMRAAGMNPIFAYKAGGAQSPTMTNSMAGASDTFNKTTASALAMSKNKKELELLNRQVALTDTQNDKLSSESRLAMINADTASLDFLGRAIRQPGFIKANEIENKYNLQSIDRVSQSLTPIMNSVWSAKSAVSPKSSIYRRLKK